MQLPSFFEGRERTFGSLGQGNLDQPALRQGKPRLTCRWIDEFFEFDKPQALS
jgi:hypothetical protein